MATTSDSPPQNVSGYTHASRRDNNSVSSTTSRGSDGERRSKASKPQVESAVTKLLVSIKQLLEALTLWSTEKMNEADVSDVYVRLGNDFNAAVAAFRQYNIDMNELLSVPDDLRKVLEHCLSEDATPANLEIYLPTVRQIITNLLQGLRNKQSIYRRIVSERRNRESQTSERGESSRAGKMTRTDSNNNGLSRSSQQPRPSPSEGYASGPDSQRRVVSSSSRRREAISQASTVSQGDTSDDGYFAGGFMRAKSPPIEGQMSRQPSSSMSPSMNGLASPSSLPSRHPSEPRSTQPTPSRSGRDPDDADLTVVQAPPPLPTVPTVPSSVKRYSLTDKPMAVPSVVVDDATPPPSANNISKMVNGHAEADSSAPESPPAISISVPPSHAPVIENSLAALKKSDTLERRASKRFSTYNISKMTGVKDRSGLGRSLNRKSRVVDPSSISRTDLENVIEEEEISSLGKLTGRDASRSKSRENSLSRRARSTTPGQDDKTVPTPPAPDTGSSQSAPPPTPPEKEEAPRSATSRRGRVPSMIQEEEEPTSPQTMTVFLQLGREVKKVSIERGLSFASLRVLFVDKFSYSPGKDNFPAIYIREPSGNVMYELEDIDEVRDRCTLSLNIDPLDQIKQHIDVQISSISSELKELRSSVSASKRASISRQPAIIAQPFAEAEASVSRPTEGQFQRVARRISRLVSDERMETMNGITPQFTGQTLQAQMTGASIMSEASGRIVADLKSQFDEVQNLRRDLGVMRQVFTDFVRTTKDTLGQARTHTQQVRQLANTKIGGARAYIDSGKSSLDTRTQNVLTRVEELQDTVEHLKDDVLKRFVSPRSQVLKTVTKDVAETGAELESLKEYIATVKPMWKKTWEEELQNIVEEQQFLQYQEDFLADLLDDHKALLEVFGHVEKVISLRGAGAATKSRGFKPPIPDESSNGGLSNVMLEIRSAQVDPERRLKAIEANQKNREKELASRSDEFEQELHTFVSGKKLKLTGGAEETERLRQKRNEIQLKAMFNASSPSLGSIPSTASTTFTSSEPSSPVA